MLLLFLINLTVGILLIWSGYIIYKKRKYNLIAGYNDMSVEQRKSVNIKRQSKALKNILYFIGVSIAILPSTLQVIGCSNWGRMYPIIILPAAGYYIIISILSISGKMEEDSKR